MKIKSKRRRNGRKNDSDKNGEIGLERKIIIVNKYNWRV